MSVKTMNLMTPTRNISYLVPKMMVRNMYLGGTWSVNPHPLSKEVWNNQTQLQEYIRVKRQVRNTGSKWSYQGKVNFLPSEVDHSGLEGP